MVGSGSPDVAASADSPITPPLPASASRIVKARSMDCTPPAERCLGSSGPASAVASTSLGHCRQPLPDLLGVQLDSGLSDG